jgi:predicted tellurium resistance membrane protein TerC
MVGRLPIWLVLLVLVSGAYAEERDVILVLDNTGAMKSVDDKGVAGSAVDGFVEKLKGDVRAAVVFLDRSATVFVPLIAVTDKSRLGFLETLQKLNYHGKYPDTVAALEQALREFEIHGREGAEKSIILLTGGTPDPSDTALVQSRLRALGYEVGPIDGVMGPKTRGAIRQFQRQVGMPADGKLNRTLLARLEEVYGARWQGELTAKAARAGVKVIVVALGEGSVLGQALAEKTSGEYLQIPKAEDLAGVFERLSSAFSQGTEIPALAPEAPAIQAPEGVEILPEQPARVAFSEEGPKMTEWLASPEAWIALITLTVLEIVLGVDNIIFISILVFRLPPEQRQRARVLGLGLAMFTRLALLLMLAWMMRLTTPLFTVLSQEISGRDLILVGGGLFLLVKSVMEIHSALEGGGEYEQQGTRYAGFLSILVQIAILDIIFSLDSVITAVGMVSHLPVMMLAIVIAVLVMMFAAKPIGEFVDEHPTIKMLALAFLILVGVALIGEGFEMHIPKGYVYFAMAFAVAVEMLNLRLRRKHAPVKLHKGVGSGGAESSPNRGLAFTTAD